jgi:hypothetical protein
VATAACIGPAADGRLSRIDGAVLLGTFVPLVAAVVLWRPARAGEADERPPRPDRVAARVPRGLAGLVVGASCSSSAPSGS